jgi:hypothetical protein
MVGAAEIANGTFTGIPKANVSRIWWGSGLIGIG